jgi:hypothetical protein
MNDIKFNCPQCGQHLAVDATGAGTSVACPQCGTSILVPQLARQTASPAPPRRTKWWLWLSAGMAALALVAGLLIWQKPSRKTTAADPASTITSAENSKSTKTPALAADLMRGLVLHFDFAAKPVTEKIPDLSGQGNTGEAVGVQWVCGGHRGGSIVFGPTNNYIRVPNSDSLNPSNITLAVWIKTDNHGNTARRIFDKGYSDGYAMSIGGYSKPAPAQDRSFVEIGMKINDNKGCTGSEKPVTDGRWHHLATTYNGAETFFYVDGVPQKQWGEHWDGKVPANSHDLTLGQNRSTPNADFGEVGASFNGMMDDVMMFNRALSAEEVQALYASQKVAGDASPLQTSSYDQKTSNLKEKWSKALNDAIRDFQSNNDQESANFVSGILASLDQPAGMSPAALAADGQRMNDRVRELVRRGALESGASLNWAAWSVLFQPGYAPNGPPNPNRKTGGQPGPGGLVLYLPLNKPGDDDNGRIPKEFGAMVRDESGAGNDGLVVGAQWVPDGKFGGAYQFHITNLTDWIVIHNSDTLNPDYITVAAWIKAADKDGFWNRIVDKDWRNGFCLSLGGDYKGNAHRGKLVFESSAGQIEKGPALDDNRWHHVAITFDGKMISAFIDGVGQSQPAKDTGPLKKSTWDLCIGNSVVDYGTGEFIAFDGLIDEVRIYNRALSAEEVRALYDAQKTAPDAVSQKKP